MTIDRGGGGAGGTGSHRIPDLGSGYWQDNTC